jgi:hypothetical protein
VRVTRALVVLCVVAGCSRPADPPAPEIIDLSASIEPFRREFDAHRGEARFLTLLAPS